MVYKCVVVVSSDDGAVQRTLALDAAPSTLDELCEHLKTLDLRLQALPFTVSLTLSSPGAELVELASDSDVTRLWPANEGDVTLDVRIEGTADPHSIFSSTYFGSEVVSLIIYPPLKNGLNADADVVEKQLVVPLTGALAALQRAIYCSLPTTAGLRASNLTLFQVTGDSTRELVALRNDDDAEALLHKHAKSGTSLAVTYTVPETTPRKTAPKPAPTPSHVPSMAPPPPVSQKPQPARPSPPPSTTKYPAAEPLAPSPPAARTPTASATSATTAAAVPGSSCPANNTESAPSPHQVRNEPQPAASSASLSSRPAQSTPTSTATTPTKRPPASAPPPAAPPTPEATATTPPLVHSTESVPEATLAPVKRERCAHVRVSWNTRLTDAETIDFWYNKKEAGILVRLTDLCLEQTAAAAHCADGVPTPNTATASLSVLSGGQTTLLSEDADLREWLVMTRESGAVLNIVLSLSSPPKANAADAAPSPVEASNEKVSPTQSSAPLTPTPPSQPRPPSAPSAAAAAASSPPRRLSVVEADAAGAAAGAAAAAIETHSAAQSKSSDSTVASGTESPTNSMGTGSASLPSHNDASGPFKTSVAVDDDDAVPVFISAPPAVIDHTGLEALAQFFVRWGDAEAFVQCTLRPGLMLDDLKVAIFDEFNVQLRTSSSMHLFVRDRWRTPDTSDPLDTEAKLRALVEGTSCELIVIEVRATARASATPANPPQFLTALTDKLAQRLFYILASDSEVSALQRLVQPCEARLENEKHTPAFSFFSTIRALSPTLALPRTVKGLSDFITQLLQDVPPEEGIRAVQSCLTQCHCVNIAQPLSLLRDQYFAEAALTDVSGSAVPPTAYRTAQRVVEIFCATQLTAATESDTTTAPELEAAQSDKQNTHVTDDRPLVPGLLTDLFAKDVECMAGLAKARASGALRLRSRLADPPDEAHGVVIDYLRRELKHSFDSCSAAKLEAFIQNPETSATAAHDAVLSIVGGLLAPHPVANGTLWLQEHFKSKMSDVLYTKMRTFARSDAVALPHLTKCCWTILDPALDPSQLLVCSSSASYMARWALLALQLECLHRGLVFPPPAPYGTVRKGPRPVSFSNLAFRANSTISSSIPSTTLGALRPGRERGKGKKVHYRYKFNWNELGSPKAFDRVTAKKK